MKRKIGWLVFVLLFLGTIFVTVPIVKAQQQAKIPRIGILTLTAKPNDTEAAFEDELHNLGWVKGQNITIEYRRATRDTLVRLDQELVEMKVDILAARATPAVNAAKNATQTIPIVMISSADAVGSGFVKSLARPGGNITGNTFILPELAGKRIELLKEIMPKLPRIAFLAYGPDPAHKLFVKHAQDAADGFKIEFQPLIMKDVAEIDGAFESFEKARTDAVIVQTLFGPILGQSKLIGTLGVKHRVATISDGVGFAEQGAMVFYGPDALLMSRRGAVFVDKILKGAKPADIPVEQPTKFDLIVNLKAVKQIGLTIPPHVLARADKVIR